MSEFSSEDYSPEFPPPDYRIPKNTHDNKINNLSKIPKEVSERKRVEETYRMLEKAAEQSIDGIAVADMKGIIRFANRTWAKMHGYGTEELLGKHLRIFHTKEQMRKDVRPFNEQVKKKGFHHGEVGHLRKDGTVFLTWMSTSVLKDEKGNLIGILGIARDITERKQIEETLQRSESQYRTTLNSMADAIHVVDNKLRLILFNAAFEEWNKELNLETDVIGKTIFEVFPFLPERVRDEYHMVFESGKVFVTEEHTRVGDKDFITETRKIPIFKEKRVIQVATIIRDITECKRAGEELRKSEERFGQVAENALEWIWEVDNNGLYTYASPIAEKVLGYKPEEIIGKKYFYDFFHPKYRQGLKKKAFEVFAKKQPFREFINRNVHKNGKTVWLSTSGVPILDEKGNFLGYRGADTDITERKQAEEQQNTMTKCMRAIVKVADELIACPDIEIIFRKAVEFGREKLGLERCAIFIEEKNYMQGTYGTDRYGRTTDEHKNQSIKDKVWMRRLKMLRPQDPRWVVVEEPYIEWDNNETVQIGEGWIVVTPIQSANRSIGVFVNDTAITGAVLDKMQQEILAVFCSLLGDIIERKRAEKELEISNKELLKSNRRLKQLALRDSHTGLYNHRYLSEAIETEFYRARRYKHSLSVIMLDLDYFKSINDVYGHQFGDLVLRQFARQLKRKVRKYDILIRFGGEEFIVISPGIDRSTALTLAQRLLEDITACNFGNKEYNVKLKLSIGVASYPEDRIVKAMDLIELVDQVLSKAKVDGGDRAYTSLDIQKSRSTILEKVTEVADIQFLKERINRLNKRANQGLIEAVFAFAKTIKLKDHYTGEHVENTVLYAAEVSRILHLPKDEIENIRNAAMVHDLGKIGISERILLKKGKLTKGEFEEIKKHPRIGVNILRPIHFFHNIIPYILHHHERWDGKGYPAGLKKEEIPLGARIVAVADVYQALISDRPYRKAYPKPRAIEIIKEGYGTQFDPDIVRLFLKLL